LKKTIPKQLSQLAKYNQTITDYFKKLGTSKDTFDLRQQIKSAIHEATALSRQINNSLNGTSEEERDLTIQKLKKDYGKQVITLKETVDQIQIKEQQFQPHLESTKKELNPIVTREERYLPMPEENQKENEYCIDEIPIHNGKEREQQPEEMTLCQVQEEEQLVEGDIRLMELEIREEKVYQMVQNLEEVKSAFNDLSDLVKIQQENVDELEEIVLDTAQNVKSGTENLVIGSEHQKDYRKNMCYLLIILLVVLIVVAAVIFGYRNKK